MTCEQNTPAKTQEEGSTIAMKGIVEIVKVPVMNLNKYTEDGQLCGASINPKKVAEELEEDRLSGVLYFCTTDDMKRRGEKLKGRGEFPLNEKYSRIEEGPGFAFVFVSTDKQ